MYSGVRRPFLHVQSGVWVAFSLSDGQVACSILSEARNLVSVALCLALEWKVLSHDRDDNTVKYSTCQQELVTIWKDQSQT